MTDGVAATRQANEIEEFVSRMSADDSTAQPTPGTDAVRAFYDRFSDERSKRYAERANPRIEKAIARILPLVREHSTIFEIGCGAGLVAEELMRKACRGSFWGCDISEKAIALAKSRVTSDNAHFRRLDAVAQFADLRSWLPKAVDLVVMVDVIEHLPLDSHAGFFRNLTDVLHSGSAVVLTFPSPHYQQHLRDHNPAELQVVDEIIELPHLQMRAEENGLFVKEYALVDVWLPNQYAHCILKRRVPICSEADEPALAGREIAHLVAPGEKVILVDDDAWSGRLPQELKTLPFIEHAGAYWGTPANDEIAISELERLRETGAKYIVFARPSFWWLDYYAGFQAHLRERYSCILENDRIIVFSLVV